MLRKKLLARLGLLVAGFVAGAVVSIALLQNVLHDVDAMKSDAEAIIDGVQDLGRVFASVETDVTTLNRSPVVDNGPLQARRADLAAVLQKLSAHEVMQAPEGEGAVVFDRVRKQFSAYFVDAVRPSADGLPGREVVAEAVALRNGIADLGEIARRHVDAEQAAVSHRLRTLIVGLTIAALLITNLAICVLVKTANMILRPVQELIAGSRELASEHFEHRINITQHDEFDELARAYNALADQLATNEQRKVTALQQLAVTLNHELNNVINIIELQLQLLNRRTGSDPVLASHLSSIHRNLERMAGVVASLRDVRRVVVTEYLPGETMLDLPKSIAPESPEIAVSRHSSGVSAS